MRIDLYTKTILTLILLVLMVIALKPMIRPTPVSADSGLIGVQFSAVPGGFYLLDGKTGTLWEYDFANDSYYITNHGKITRLGEQLTK